MGGGGVLHVLPVKHLTGAACRKCLAESAASLEKSLPARHLLNAGSLRPPKLATLTTLRKSLFRATNESRGIGRGNKSNREREKKAEAVQLFLGFC